jgi:Fe-S cluster assembly scaffold protein SufB
MNPDCIHNDWYLNSPINLLLADRRNNGLNLYQPYLKPTGRLGDIAVIHSINPVGYKILPDTNVDLNIKLADVFDDKDLSCNVIIVDVGSNSNASISEFIHAKNGTKIVKVLYLVREGATLNLDRTFDVNNKKDSLCVLESQVIQFPGSTFNAYIQSEGNNYNQDLMFIDVYKNCTTNIKGNHYLYDSNKNNSVVNVHHKGPNSTSRVDIRSVLEDNAYSSFLGEIKVDKIAEGVDADLKNKNLLCSSNATAFTEPQLDINTKEITCSHGCTISNIDKSILYYLNSRGIDNVAGGDIIKQCFLTQ